MGEHPLCFYSRKNITIETIPTRRERKQFDHFFVFLCRSSVPSIFPFLVCHLSIDTIKVYMRFRYSFLPRLDVIQLMPSSRNVSINRLEHVHFLERDNLHWNNIHKNDKISMIIIYIVLTATVLRRLGK